MAKPTVILQTDADWRVAIRALHGQVAMRVFPADDSQRHPLVPEDSDWGDRVTIPLGIGDAIVLGSLLVGPGATPIQLHTSEGWQLEVGPVMLVNLHEEDEDDEMDILEGPREFSIWHRQGSEGSVKITLSETDCHGVAAGLNAMVEIARRLDEEDKPTIDRKRPAGRPRIVQEAEVMPDVSAEDLLNNPQIVGTAKTD